MISSIAPQKVMIAYKYLNNPYNEPDPITLYDVDYLVNNFL